MLCIGLPVVHDAKLKEAAADTCAKPYPSDP